MSTCFIFMSHSSRNNWACLLTFQWLLAMQPSKTTSKKEEEKIGIDHCVCVYGNIIIITITHPTAKSQHFFELMAS